MTDEELVAEFEAMSHDRYASAQRNERLIKAAAQSDNADVRIGGLTHQASHLHVALSLDDALDMVLEASQEAELNPTITYPVVRTWMHTLHAAILEELGQTTKATQPITAALQIASEYGLTDHWDNVVAMYLDVSEMNVNDSETSMEILEMMLLLSPYRTPIRSDAKTLLRVLQLVRRERWAAEVRLRLIDQPGLTKRTKAVMMVTAGRNFMAVGDFARATETFAEAHSLMETGPEWAKVRSTLLTAESHLDLIFNRPQQALARLEGLVDELPNYPSARARCMITYALALSRTGRPVEALERLHEIEPLAIDNGRYRQPFLETRAEVLGSLGRVHDQAEVLRELVEFIELTTIPESKLVNIEHRLSAWDTALTREFDIAVDIDRQWLINSRIMTLIAKDLRGPASSLLMGAQLVGSQTDNDTPPSSGVMDLVRAALVELNLSLDHLNDADFIDTDRPHLDDRDLSLPQLLAEVRDSTQPLWSVRGVTVSVDAVDGHQPLIDSQLTKRVVAGLIRAASAELASGGAITIVGTDDARVTIEVTGLDDDGVRSLADRLHQRWLSPQAGPADPPSGWAGLALSLSNLIAKGGNIGLADREPGSDSDVGTFRVAMSLGALDRLPATR